MYRPLTIGSLALPGNIFLAPVAGYTDRGFRSICVEAGADFTYTELISSEALVRDGTKTFFLVRRGKKEKKYGIQLFGADPGVIYRATARIAGYRPDLVDINAGCPVPKVVKTGAGSALMRNPALLGRVVEAAVQGAADFLGGAPVTVKLRSGWDAASLNYRECARTAAEAGASLVTLHPRTKAQGYGGKADWFFLKDLVSSIKIPVIGSGDLFTPEDAGKMFAETGCAGIMFARGAIGNPFIFAETKSFLLTGGYTPASASARLSTGFRHLLSLAEDAGEKTACREMRKHFCAYTKGISESASLRNRLVHAETIADYRELLGERADLTEAAATVPGEPSR